MKDQLVQQETTAPSVYQDKPVPVEPKDQREPQVQPALLDQKVWLEMPDHKENKEQLDCQDLQVELVNQEHHQDHQDHEEQEDPQVLQDQSVPEDQREL